MQIWYYIYTIRCGSNILYVRCVCGRTQVGTQVLRDDGRADCLLHLTYLLGRLRILIDRLATRARRQGAARGVTNLPTVP